MSVTSASADKQPAGDIPAVRDLLRHQHSSAAAYVQSVLAAIHRANPGLRAFTAIGEDEALADAGAADQAIGRFGAAAWQRQPLLGVTVSVKDLIQTGGLPTRRGSMLANRRPAADAPAVARLRAAGAIIVGKTATSEYGWSASTVSRVAPPTRNPWALERSAGGSSGGAAAAVAAGLCTLALGTDGAGSVRIPAAFCGVVGFKPSFGSVPYVPPCADRLAHLGLLARSVADVAAGMAVIGGPDSDDPDSGVRALDQPRPQALRIGWMEFPGTTTEIRAVSGRAWPVLAGQGHRLERIEVPFPEPYRALVDILAAAEAAQTSPEDEPLCDAGRVRVARYGRSVTGAAVMQAEGTRIALRATLASVMRHYDLLVMATVGIEPFGVDEIAPPSAAGPDGLGWLAWSPATYPFNMTGQPALSLPVGVTSSGLPVGLQLVGPVGRDDLVLAAAERLEAGLGGPAVPPAPLMKG